MEHKPMSLTRRQKEALLVMVADRRKFSELSERQQRYLKAKGARIFDEKAARAASREAQGQIDAD